MKYTLLLLMIVVVGCSQQPKFGSVEVGDQSIVYITDQAGFILNTKQGQIHMQALDKDEDGTADLIRYSVFDTNGQEIIEVEDSTLNGEINQRWHKKDPSYIEILYLGEWYKVHKSESGPYIEVHGNNIPVSNEHGYLYPKTHNQ